MGSLSNQQQNNPASFSEPTADINSYFVRYIPLKILVLSSVSDTYSFDTDTDSDADSEYGSGPTDLIESGFNPDPDPKLIFLPLQ